DPRVAASVSAACGERVPGAERLADRPRLGDAAARREGRIAVEDLGDGAHAVVGEVVGERLEEGTRHGRVAIHLVVGERERTEEPRRRRANPRIAWSALYQRALISIALPRRGVTIRSPAFASIHVSWTPGAPAVSSPSVGSSLMP